MRGLLCQSIVGSLGLALSACASDPQDQRDPVVERETGASTDQVSEPSPADCVGLPAQIGEPPNTPKVELPGPVHALVARDHLAFACGGTEADSGYLAALTTNGAGQPQLAQTRRLQAPCVGLVLGAQGLAILLSGGRVLWLPEGQAQLDRPGFVTQTSAVHGPSARVWRGAWSAQPASLYLAAGVDGVLRLDVTDAGLVQAQSFALDEIQDARDVLVSGEQLLVADAAQGLLVFELQDQALHARWRDSSYMSHPGTQRIVSLTPTQVAIAAGYAGSYVVDTTEFEALRHERYAGPVFDVAAGEGGAFALTASRLYQDQELQSQRFPELLEQAGFQALAPGPEGSLWVATGSCVEYWPKLQATRAARVVPLLGFGTALHGVSGNATAEITFEVHGEGELWVQRPNALAGSGLRIEALSWPTQTPSCEEHSRFEAGQRFSVRLLASNPEKLAKTVPFRLRSSDPQHGDLGLEVDLDAPRPRDRVGGSLPSTPLVTPSGQLRPIQGFGVWNWLEFVPAQALDSADVLARLRVLAKLVKAQRRNGQRGLAACVVVGGQYPQLEPLIWAELERLREMGLDFYFDERFAMHRSFSRLPNGRLYPLRVLVDPQRKIRYLDQNLGSATATAKFRELKDLVRVSTSDPEGVRP